MMNPMDDLVQFLRARLDEDDAIARATEWCAGTKTFNGWDESPVDEDDYEVRSRGATIARGMGPEFARHIARHDPARVLAEVDAKRRVLASYTQAVRVRDEAMKWVKEPVFTNPGAAGIERWNDARDVAHFLDPVVRILALPYADHPDYRDTWRP